MKKIKYYMEILFIIIIVGAPQYYLIKKDVSWQTMLIALIASVIILFFANLNFFNEMTIKKDGLSLKLREAKQIVTEAYATMDTIRNSMEPLINFQYDMIDKGYFPEYIKYEDVQETINKLVSVAENLNLDETTKNIFSTKKYIVARQAAYNVIFFFETRNICDSIAIIRMRQSISKNLSDFVDQVNKELYKLDSKNEIESWYIFETKKLLEFITDSMIEVQQKR
ncbi:hypothetical protein V4W98_12615 [Enterococcus faecium]|uniref:hypothetical protein n=1 Tax=Enterococcus faecium TaxID=1352 RepID=UPI00206CD70F|nr:MAG TPA: hypothetical protein [Caudoviricetes sp.]